MQKCARLQPLKEARLKGKELKGFGLIGSLVLALLFGFVSMSSAADSPTPDAASQAPAKPAKKKAGKKKASTKKSKKTHKSRSAPEALSPTAGALSGAAADLTGTAVSLSSTVSSLAVSGTASASLSVTAQSLTSTASATALTPTAKVEPAAKPTVQTTPEAAKPANLPHRSPALAHFLAFFPGIAIHGTGHLYAGSYFKGLGLLALEGASAYVVYNESYLAIAQANADGFGPNNSKTNNSSVTFPSNLNPYVAHAGVAMVGTLTFLFSWFDDMSGAGVAAEKFNERAQLEAEAAKAEVSLGPTLIKDGPGVALLARF
jgi:hypothetical protein